ncbi:ETEC_3214 domain-containing protein [Lentzea sp. NPDC051838]|uniref:ETEC_3214 domain-containing protein n=1 Tax=Lentzea sp. NPDC051838 TaxID=3154849 RepID=UPI00341DFB72
MSFKDLLGSLDNVTASVVAIVLIFGMSRGLYRKTVGSRRAERSKLDSLSCGNPLEYVEDLFGPSRYRNTSIGLLRSPEGRVTVERRVYKTTYGWLTVHFVDAAVVGYAFTLTHKRFRYDLAVQSFGQISGALGHRTFADFHPGKPQHGELFKGASECDYTEFVEFGRPGQYQAYGLSASMSGWSNARPSYEDVSPTAWGAYEKPKKKLRLPELKLGIEEALVVQFRKNTAPDTFAVFGGSYVFEHYKSPACSGAIGNGQMVLLNKRQLVSRPRPSLK